jgi:hypothetical protein
VNSTARQHARDLIAVDERPRGIMHRDVACDGPEQIQSGLDGILSMDAARNNVPHFLEFGSPRQFLEFSQPIVPADQNNFIDAFRALEGLKRVHYDRFVPQQREEFVETHPLTAACSDDDRA